MRVGILEIRRQDMDTSIKRYLEQRVRCNTRYSDCRVCRAVFYLWDETDRAASEFCAELKTMKNGNAHAVSVKKPEEAAEALHNAWEECREKAEEYAWAYPKGLYTLVIGSSSGIAQNANLKGNVEFVRVVENSGLHHLSGDTLTDCQIEWRIRKSDVSAAAALLMHAAYSERTLFPSGAGLKDHYVFGLKWREYHAVREDICRYYLAILDQCLEETEYDLEKVEKCLYIKQKVEQVCVRCVKAQWLPYIGYKKLEKELKRQCKKVFFSQIVALFSERYRITETDWTVRQVLEVFQGEVSGIPNVEILRNKVKVEKLPELCKEVIKQNENMLEELLERNFSLYDLNYTLSCNLEEYSRQILRSASLIKDKLEESLSRKFAVRNLKLQGILEGLEQYYSLWNDYIEICAEGIYLRKLAEFVRQLWDKENKNYEELKMAEAVLAESMDCKFWASASVEEGANLGKVICSQDDLLGMLRNHISLAEFREGDVVKVISEADENYQKTDEMHVDSSRHPQIQLIFNSELDEREKGKNSCFEWVLHAVNYIPKSVMWELRVYVYRNGKVGVESDS